jgi:hypothetical protein
MELEVFTAVKISIVVFWVVTPCSIVGGYMRFGGTCLLHPEGRFTTLVITVRIKCAFMKLDFNEESLQ